MARVLDKTQDSQEVIRLVEKLRQAILVYQVGARDLWNWKLLTCETGITTTIHIPPGCPADCEFLPHVFDFETQWEDCRLKASFDTLLKVYQVREHVCNQGHWMNSLQKLTVSAKIRSVHTRLDWIGEERDTARNADELRQQKRLFECVFPTNHEWPSTLNRSQGTRGNQGQTATSIQTLQYR